MREPPETNRNDWCQEIYGEARKPCADSHVTTGSKKKRNAPGHIILLAGAPYVEETRALAADYRRAKECGPFTVERSVARHPFPRLFAFMSQN